jgi:hypothetical protein
MAECRNTGSEVHFGAPATSLNSCSILEMTARRSVCYMAMHGLRLMLRLDVTLRFKQKVLDHLHSS